MTDLHTISNTADLRQALQSGQLHRVTVESLDLPPLRLQNLALEHVKLLGPRLTGLHVEHLEARHIQARGVLLRAAMLPGAILAQWHVSASQAQELQVPAGQLDECQFVDTPLTNANFRRALLTNCTFQGADLNHATLAESVMLNCRFEDTRQGGAVLDNADLQNAVLYQVDLRGANLLRANFTGAILVDVDLRDANLRDARFDGALLLNSNLERTDFAALMQKPANAAEILAKLGRLPPEQVLAIAAGLLSRTAASPRQTMTQQTASTGPDSQSANTLGNLLKLPFPALVRELQGRGGPPELGRLRVDGEHVWATAHTGDEVRLTSGPTLQRQASQMMVPLPGQGPGPQPRRETAITAKMPAVRGETGKTENAGGPERGNAPAGGLEID